MPKSKIIRKSTAEPAHKEGKRVPNSRVDDGIRGPKYHFGDKKSSKKRRSRKAY